MKTWTRHIAFRLLVVAGTLGLGLAEVAVAQDPTVVSIVRVVRRRPMRRVWTIR